MGRGVNLSMNFLIRKLPPEQKRRRLVALEILMLLFALFIMVIGGNNLVYITLSLGQKSSLRQRPLGVVYHPLFLQRVIDHFYCIHNILHPGEALD